MRLRYRPFTADPFAVAVERAEQSYEQLALPASPLPLSLDETCSVSFADACIALQPVPMMLPEEGTALKSSAAMTQAFQESMLKAGHARAC